METQPNKKSPARFIQLLLIPIIVAMAALLFYAVFQAAAPKNQQENKALIGGEFTLTNQRGETISSKDFAGKYMLVYFGFTNCPEVCPVDLQIMTEAMNLLKDDADKVQPIFITIDPERDTVSQLASHFSNFHSAFQALTGSREDVDKVQKAYRVYSQRADDKQLAEYTMDHSAFIYLMDKEGHYLTHFHHNTPTVEIVKKMKEYF